MLLNKERMYLRMCEARLRQANEYACKVVPIPTDLVDHIATAQAALQEAIDPLLVKMEGKEPLNETEEVLYDKLQHVLRFNDDLWANVTPEQRFAAARSIMRQGGPNKIQHPVSGGHSKDMIGISFGHIFIGIEPDGYAHS